MGGLEPTDSSPSAPQTPSPGPTSDTARLETFADGVMAIAITLLVLEIRVPPHAPGRLGHALAEQWPSYAAYVVSFLSIGVIWVNHHRMFKLIERITHNFLMLNVVFLMVLHRHLRVRGHHDAHGRHVQRRVGLRRGRPPAAGGGTESGGHPEGDPQLPKGPRPLPGPHAGRADQSLRQPCRVRRSGGVLAAPRKRSRVKPNQS